jgi:hypothetical protein
MQKCFRKSVYKSAYVCKSATDLWGELHECAALHRLKSVIARLGVQSQRRESSDSEQLSGKLHDQS